MWNTNWNAKETSKSWGGIMWAKMWKLKFKISKRWSEGIWWGLECVLVKAWCRVEHTVWQRGLRIFQHCHLDSKSWCWSNCQLNSKSRQLKRSPSLKYSVPSKTASYHTINSKPLGAHSCNFPWKLTVELSYLFQDDIFKVIFVKLC